MTAKALAGRGRARASQPDRQTDRQTEPMRDRQTDRDTQRAGERERQRQRQRAGESRREKEVRGSVVNIEVDLGSYSQSAPSLVPDKPYGFCGR